MSLEEVGRHPGHRWSDVTRRYAHQTLGALGSGPAGARGDGPLPVDDRLSLTTLRNCGLSLRLGANRPKGQLTIAVTKLG